MTEEQKKEYKSLIEKQYQNLSYKIKNEEIVGNNATVEVEIEVLDYATSINNSKKYFLEHESEFLKENEAQIKEDDLDKAKTYIDYKKGVLLTPQATVVASLTEDELKATKGKKNALTKSLLLERAKTDYLEDALESYES